MEPLLGGRWAGSAAHCGHCCSCACLAPSMSGCVCVCSYIASVLAVRVHRYATPTAMRMLQAVLKTLPFVLDIAIFAFVLLVVFSVIGVQVRTQAAPGFAACVSFTCPCGWAALRWVIRG